MTDLAFGRKPPKNAPALRLKAVLSGTIPSHPAAADHLNIGGWDMLGNDQYGTCVAVTWANYRRVLTRLVGRESYPGWEAVQTVYRTQNPDFPAQDDGMDIQTLLEYLTHNGGPDGVRPIAFAKVDHTNPDEVKGAIAIFGAVWVGVDVTAANMDQFDSGKPWDYVARSANEGGHSIIVGGYDSDGVGGDETFVTWAAETSFTDNFWTHQVEEAWVVIWPENIGTAQFEQGVDLAALALAYQALTGRVLPNLVVTPTPAPVSPAAVDETLVEAMEPWAKGIVSTYTHAGKAAAAYRKWKIARGL